MNCSPANPSRLHGPSPTAAAFTTRIEFQTLPSKSAARQRFFYFFGRARAGSLLRDKWQKRCSLNELVKDASKCYWFDCQLTRGVACKFTFCAGQFYFSCSSRGRRWPEI